VPAVGAHVQLTEVVGGGLDHVGVVGELLDGLLDLGGAGQLGHGGLAVAGELVGVDLVEGVGAVALVGGALETDDDTIVSVVTRLGGAGTDGIGRGGWWCDPDWGGRVTTRGRGRSGGEPGERDRLPHHPVERPRGHDRAGTEHAEDRDHEQGPEGKTHEQFLALTPIVLGRQQRGWRRGGPGTGASSAQKGMGVGNGTGSTRQGRGVVEHMTYIRWQVTQFT
jgi:hypothetical protein